MIPMGIKLVEGGMAEIVKLVGDCRFPETHLVETAVEFLADDKRRVRRWDSRQVAFATLDVVGKNLGRSIIANQGYLGPFSCRELLGGSGGKTGIAHLEDDAAFST